MTEKTPEQIDAEFDEVREKIYAYRQALRDKFKAMTDNQLRAHMDVLKRSIGDEYVADKWRLARAILAARVAARKRMRTSKLKGLHATTLVKMTLEMRKEVETIADKCGINMSEFIRQAIQNEIEDYYADD